MSKNQNDIWKFRLGSVSDFNTLCKELGCKIEAIDDISSLAEPVKVNNLRIPNSLAVHPMEGVDGDNEGRPSPLTIRRYKRFAAGGAGLIWTEAIAVVPEGRANPRQLWLNENSKDAFTDIVAKMRQAATASMGTEHKPIIVAQLTHSGRYSKPDGTAKPLVPERDPYRDPLIPEPNPTTDRTSKVGDSCVISDEYLDNLQNAYVNAARLAYEAGFDAVDIKSCHGYLVNELLASRNRPGKYGSSFENRIRFVIEVIEKINAELGDKIEVCTRLGFYDAIPYPYGWGVDEQDYTKANLTEPKKLVGLLYEKGVRLINFTIANPYYNPHVGRPFNQPVKRAYNEPEHPLKSIERLINLCGQVQKDFPDIAFVGTGYSWLRQLLPNVAAATKQAGKAKIIGAGRMAFAYPDFAKNLLAKGRLDANKVCVGCSACTQLMRDGQMAGCVVRDNKIYGPIFRHGRMSDPDNLKRLAQQCLQCQEPTCQRGCPAGIEIPVFIQQFLEGDEKGAYETIRKANVFPEVCAWLCPVEQQCQGHCLQRFIGDDALPIADIQRYLAKQANKKGWSKINIPQESTGKRIAVVGAGPAGLAAAVILLEVGHKVILFDKNTELGGMIQLVIPADRQETALAHELQAVFKDVPGDRLELRLGSGLDEKFTLDNVIAEGFDSVLLGMGLPRAIRSSQENLVGLYDALEFLKLAKINIMNLSEKRVAVIGGGNTAMDAAVTAKQAGVSDVYLIYRRSFAEMPAWDAERDRALAEGVHFLILTQQLDYISDNGKLKGIRLCSTVLGDPDESGRRKPQPVKDSDYILDFDIVIEAIGQQSSRELKKILPGVAIKDGQIKIENDGFCTSRDSVFAAGDIVTGPATVVGTIADGMKAAKQIDNYLKADLKNEL